eukprot:ANDGO_07541.mRNA.1 hypothetical protein
MMHSKMVLTNLSLQELGARVVSASSMQAGYALPSVISPDSECPWTSSAACPQSIVLTLAPRDVPVISVGIYTSTESQSNPRTISLQVARSSMYSDLSKAVFREWCVLNCALMKRQQVFPVPAIPKEYDVFKFVFVETFGAEFVYVNQLFLYADLNLGGSLFRSSLWSPASPVRSSRTRRLGLSKSSSEALVRMSHINESSYFSEALDRVPPPPEHMDSSVADSSTSSSSSNVSSIVASKKPSSCSPGLRHRSSNVPCEMHNQSVNTIPEMRSIAVQNSPEFGHGHRTVGVSPAPDVPPDALHDVMNRRSRSQLETAIHDMQLAVEDVVVLRSGIRPDGTWHETRIELRPEAPSDFCQSRLADPDSSINQPIAMRLFHETALDDLTSVERQLLHFVSYADNRRGWICWNNSTFKSTLH